MRAKDKLRTIVKETPQSITPIRGRGASWSPANRFEKLHIDCTDFDVPDMGPETSKTPRAQTQYFRDGTKSVITRNNSPDVGFETSLNPYRGCEHGCIYCFARPTHGSLGLSPVLDFETRILAQVHPAQRPRRPHAVRSQRAAPGPLHALLPPASLSNEYSVIPALSVITPPAILAGAGCASAAPENAIAAKRPIAVVRIVIFIGSPV